MTIEQLKQELDELRKLRATAEINLHRLNGALAAIEMLIAKAEKEQTKHGESSS